MSAAETPGVIPGQGKSSITLQKGQPAGQRHSPGQDAEAVKRASDRRRFQRVNVPLLGRYMRQNREEYPCQIVNVSAGGIAVRAPAVGEIGERIVIYVDTLGRVEGEIVRVYPEGFALKLSASTYKREKIANQLTWLVNKDRLSTAEERRFDRYMPKKTVAKITFADGTAHECRLLDLSLGGAAVSVEPKPDEGSVIALGLIQGRVVRHGEQGISIEFLEIQDPATLERQFG